MASKTTDKQKQHEIISSHHLKILGLSTIQIILNINILIQYRHKWHKQQLIELIVKIKNTNSQMASNKINNIIQLLIYVTFPFYHMQLYIFSSRFQIPNQIIALAEVYNQIFVPMQYNNLFHRHNFLKNNFWQLCRFIQRILFSQPSDHSENLTPNFMYPKEPTINSPIVPENCINYCPIGRFRLLFSQDQTIIADDNHQVKLILPAQYPKDIFNRLSFKMFQPIMASGEHFIKTKDCVFKVVGIHLEQVFEVDKSTPQRIQPTTPIQSIFEQNGAPFVNDLFNNKVINIFSKEQERRLSSECEYVQFLDRTHYLKWEGTGYSLYHLSNYQSNLVATNLDYQLSRLGGVLLAFEMSYEEYQEEKTAVIFNSIENTFIKSVMKSDESEEKFGFSMWKYGVSFKSEVLNGWFPGFGEKRIVYADEFFEKQRKMNIKVYNKNIWRVFGAFGVRGESVREVEKCIKDCKLRLDEMSCVVERLTGMFQKVVAM